MSSLPQVSVSIYLLIQTEPKIIRLVSSGGGVVRGESRGAGHADQLRISPGGQRVSGEQYWPIIGQNWSRDQYWPLIGRDENPP